MVQVLFCDVLGVQSSGRSKTVKNAQNHDFHLIFTQLSQISRLMRRSFLLANWPSTFLDKFENKRRNPGVRSRPYSR